MPDIYCGQCGSIARPEDRFCRICGSPLDPAVSMEERAQDSQPGQGAERSNERDVISLNLPTSNRISCLIAAGLLFSALVLVMILFIILMNPSSGKPFFAVEVIGTPTPYPTRRPYATAIPYKTATPYPTAVPYPTTGELATVVPTAGGPFIAPSIYNPFGGCELIVKNQNAYLDSVVLLFEVNTQAVEVTVYVRANDSFSTRGISTGTYYTYVTTGQDWDALTGRFVNWVDYFRFKDPVTFDTCTFSTIGSPFFGGYQYLEVTLNVSGEQGSDAISVPPDDFPGVAP